jgi:ribonuclease HI
MHAYVQLPKFEIQVCTLYGFPASKAEARGKTNSLLEHAIHRSRLSTHPTMICGDLNHHPDKLEATQMLRQHGYRTVEEIHHGLTGQDLPPTYGNSTRNDICLLCPILAELVQQVWVDDSKMFAGHNPLCFSLQQPAAELFRQHWSIPEPWHMLQPDSTMIEAFYEPMFNEDGTITTLQDLDKFDPLQIWAVRIEQAVHRALKKQHDQSPEKFPMDGLPKKYRGRCQPRQIKKQPLPTAIKNAWSSHYTPQVDQPDMRLKHWTRQIRRIQSLKQRINKLDGIQVAPDISKQLHQEWNKILSAAGFHRSFSHWLMQYPELQVIPTDIPNTEYLYTMEQLLKLQADDLASFLRTKAKKFADFQQQQDLRKFGKKLAFKQLREPSPGLIQTVSTQQTTNAEILNQPAYGLVTVQTEATLQWDLQKVVRINNHLASITGAEETRLELMVHDEVLYFPTQVTLTQETTTSEPCKVSQELTRYWNQYWRRDTQAQQHDPQNWQTFSQMLANVPPLAAAEIELTNIDHWCRAIKDTPSKTARGSCGWSADELKSLPRLCIIDLMHLVDQFHKQGFPQWLMLSRVLPIAKHAAATEAKATRPITIMPLIYRVWARMISKQVLSLWGRILPRSITGFLPKRQASDFVYKLQLLLESVNQRQSMQHLGGLTLDLVKCFNTHPQLPIQMVLAHMGLPDSIIRCWMGSIQCNIRHWDIHQNLYPIQVATTGVPEGDNISVIAMVGINYAFVSLPHRPDILTNAFADNWSYCAFDADSHQPTVQTIVSFTNSLSLVIDWQKTWAWSTNPTHSDAYAHIMQSLLPPDTNLQQVSHARELGYILHYRKLPFRGTQKERHEAALERLRKLRHAHCSIEDKGHLAYMSALTKALFGTHMYLCGERYFQQLRTAIARALVGDHHNIQSHLACSCLTKLNCDPEYYTIMLAIKGARHFLTFAEEEDRALFMQLAVSSNALNSTITGPARAFNAYIAKLGWTINREGDIAVCAGTTLHITNSNWEDIQAAAEYAWMQHVALSISNRKGMSCIPVPHRPRTRAALLTVEQAMQTTVAIEMTAGFMTNNQKNHFDEEQPLTCEFCQDLDTKAHRLLACPATSAARFPHADVIEALEEHDHIHVLLPIAYHDPEIAFHQFLLNQLPEPQVFKPNFSPHWIFTDGSSKHPTDIDTRWASFAVVFPHMDLATLSMSQLRNPAWLLEHAFTTAAVSHVKGRQTMPRAELMAAVLAQELEHQRTVVTDSQYVIDAHHKVREAIDIKLLHTHANYDLLKRLHALVQKGISIPVQKVKAHQPLDPQHQEFWLRIGNAVADLAAQTANSQLATPVITQLIKLGKEQRQMDAFLKDQLSLRSDLAQFRAKLQQDEIQHLSPEQKLDQLLTWNIPDEEAMRYTIPEDLYYVVHASRWGTGYSQTLLDWLQTLRWPISNEYTCPPVGVSWFELAVNYMIVTQRSIPVNTAQGGPTVYKNNEDDEGFDVSAFDFTSVVNSFRDSITHLAYLTQIPIHPPVKACKVTSICILGSGHCKQGLPLRPTMYRQQATLDTILQYLRCEDNQTKPQYWRYPVVPELPKLVHQRLSAPPDNSQVKRQQRLYHRRLEIKRAKE